ncbi:MAG TPA: phage major capsid protein [Verrucomicrobiae bacterium]|jgi:HK97 family phage major capsid protein|nr:phage major capsid protein [Verrucomicrobiae bacterium]
MPNTFTQKLGLNASRQRYAIARAQEAVSTLERRLFFNGLVRTIARSRVPSKMADAVMRSLGPASGTLGGSLLPIDVSKDILDVADVYGGYHDLGVTPMSSMFTKFPKVTAHPQAFWIQPDSIGQTLPTDARFAGSSLTPEANTLSCLIQTDDELLQDEKVDLSLVFVTQTAQAIATAIDTASFVGTGANDQTNGGQTGIFVDNTIANVSAQQGNSSIAQLQRSDFVTCVKAVNRAALQHPCRWFISSQFIAPMLDLVDGQAKERLLKTPAETGDGEFYLLGFPVTWTAACPSVDAPGAKIAAFGRGESYMVALRDELEIMMSGFLIFQSSIRYIRALARGYCQTRDSSGLATLSLSNG